MGRRLARQSRRVGCVGPHLHTTLRAKSEKSDKPSSVCISGGAFPRSQGRRSSLTWRGGSNLCRCRSATVWLATTVMAFLEFLVIVLLSGGPKWSRPRSTHAAVCSSGGQKAVRVAQKCGKPGASCPVEIRGESREPRPRAPRCFGAFCQRMLGLNNFLPTSGFPVLKSNRGVLVGSSR